VEVTVKLVPYGANGDVPAMVAALQVRGLSDNFALDVKVIKCRYSYKCAQIYIRS
jgi:hypothetical protein